MAEQMAQMGREEENELVRKSAEEKDQVALSRLLIKYHPLFMRVVHDSKYGILGEDVQEIAQLYFLEAVNTFDPEKGVPFAAYLKLQIEWGLKKYLSAAYEKDMHEKEMDGRADLSRSGDREGEQVDIWDALFLQGGETTSASSAEMGGLGQHMDSFEQVEFRESLARAMGELSDRERRIVEGIYVLELPAKKVAASLGLSPSRVSHLKESALGKLRQMLGDRSGRY